MGLIVMLALAVTSAPPSTAGRRLVRDQEVETNPNWGKPFATAARFGHGYSRGASTPDSRPKPAALALRTRFWTSKFSANPWTFQITPTRDLWLAQPFPLR